MGCSDIYITVYFMSCSYDDMQHLIKAPLFCCSMRCIFCLLLVEVIYFISIFPFLYSSFCKLPAVVKVIYEEVFHRV